MKKISFNLASFICALTLSNQPLLANERPEQDLKRKAPVQLVNERPAQKARLISSNEPLEDKMMIESKEEMSQENPNIDWQQLYLEAQQQIQQKEQEIIKFKKKIADYRLLSMCMSENSNKLDMSCDLFNRFPTLICCFDNLTDLNISGSPFETLPEKLSNLRNLKSLDLSETCLSSFPEPILKLTNLENLIFFERSVGMGDCTSYTMNTFTSLPESFGCLIRLKKLNLASLGLNSLPKSFGKLTRLTNLNLCGNILKSIPDSLVKLTNLTYLNLCDNPDISRVYCVDFDDDYMEFEEESYNIQQFLMIDHRMKQSKQKFLLNAYSEDQSIPKDPINVISDFINKLYVSDLN